MTIGRDALEWRGDALHLRAGHCQGHRGPLLHLVRVEHWPDMFRVASPDDRLSDMLNRTRAREVAMHLALVELKWGRQETAPEPSPMRAISAGATWVARAPEIASVAAPRALSNKPFDKRAYQRNYMRRRRAAARGAAA
jgi:hypothetical protein